MAGTSKIRTVILQAEDMACAKVLVQGSMSQERKGGLGVCVGNESDGQGEDGEKSHNHNGFKGLTVQLESFPDGSVGKNLPAMQEPRVRSLGREDPPEEDLATHTSILAWRILQTEEPGGPQSIGSQS